MVWENKATNCPNNYSYSGAVSLLNNNSRLYNYLEPLLMINSLDYNVREFKQQSNNLALLIQADAKRWKKNTVIMRNGRLTSVLTFKQSKSNPATKNLRVIRAD